MTVPTKEDVAKRIREDFIKSGLSENSMAYTCFLEGWKRASLFYNEYIDRAMENYKN